MATKITGIKGINISKSSVLTGGSKKTSANDSTRDTVNGTTRDNSKNSAAVDDAMLKMLLGQAKLLATKTAQIEQNMQLANKKEAERQEKLLETLKEKEERQKDKAEQRAQKNYDSLNKGFTNALLSSVLGPFGVLAGKALNEIGGPLTPSKIPGKVGRLFAGTGRSKTLKNKEETESTGAISAHRKELEQEPVNNLNKTVSKGFKDVIKAIGGIKGGDGGDKKKSLWDKIKDFFKALPGMLQRGWLPTLLGNLLRWLSPLKWLAKLAGLSLLAAGFWKLYDWLKSKFGTDWANALTSGIAKGVKAGLTGVGKSLEKAANSLKALRKGSLAAKVAGAASKTLGKLANTGKVGKALFGNAAKRARAASIAAQKTLQAGQLTRTGKFLAGAGKTLSKVGKAAGVVGNAVIIGQSGYEAYKKFKAGDKKGAWGSIGKGAGTLAGSALGAKGGAAAGAAIGTMIFPGVGTAIGALIGGIGGAIGGGWLGSKLGGKAAESGYTAITGDDGTKTSMNLASSEGDYSTDNAMNASLSLQAENLNTQSEILNTLKQIEYNLSPETQMELDKGYLTSAQDMFKDGAPTVQYDTPMLNSLMTNFDNPMGK